MEVDIYGDLDHLDNQFELVQKENEELKETVQKLEEASIKFSIEVNELKRINSNLEVNISSLFKTAKAELERKNKQITELRKELDNMLFKRGPHRKIPDKRNENTEEKQILNTQFEKAQCDIDKRNKIIQSLNTELDNMRKQLNEKNNILKRNSSQIEENENDLKAKKPKLDKESYIENEEDYRKYKNRHERNSHSNSRSRSPNFGNNGPNDLRSQLHLKRINYHSRSGEEFIANNQRYNRQNYRSNRFKGKYTEYQEAPMEWEKNYRYCNKDEERQRQKYSGASTSKTSENSYRQGYISEPIFTVAPILSDTNELEDGEIEKTKLFSDTKFNNNNFNSLDVPGKSGRNLEEQVRQDDEKYTKTNISCTKSKSSSNKNELSVTETFRNNTQDICASITLNNEKKMCNPIEVKEKIIDKKKLKGDIKDLEIKKDKSKLEEKKKENVSCTTSKYVSKTKNEKSKTCIKTIENNSKSNLDKVEEFAIDGAWKVVLDENEKVIKNDAKKEENKYEIESHKNKKEKCKTIKTKPEKSTDNISDLKSTKEKVKLPVENKSKSSKSETKSKQEKEAKIIESNVSETSTSDTKIEKSNSESKGTIIKVVTETSANMSRSKKENVSESTDPIIPIVSESKLKETKEKHISESKNTNTSIVSGEVSGLQSNNTKTEKKSELSDSKIPVVKTTQSVEINMTIIPEQNDAGKSDKNKSDTTEKVEETLQSTEILKNSNNLPADIKLSEIKESSLKDNEFPVSKTETTNSKITNVEDFSTENQKIEATTQQTDRKPPMRGRRRRCVISIN